MGEINLDFAFDLHFEILLRGFRGLCGHPDNKKPSLWDGFFCLPLSRSNFNGSRSDPILSGTLARLAVRTAGGLSDISNKAKPNSGPSFAFL